MNTEEFLAAMAQDLTVKQIEDCGVIEFIKTGFIDGIRRPLNGSLSSIIENIEKFIATPMVFVKQKSLGICFNYSVGFMYKGFDNYDFYSFNWHFTQALNTGSYPIPSDNDACYWRGDNLKNRIIYMKWVIRQLNILKTEYVID